MGQLWFGPERMAKQKISGRQMTQRGSLTSPAALFCRQICRQSFQGGAALSRGFG
jgi:hypothetical protein